MGTARIVRLSPVARLSTAGTSTSDPRVTAGGRGLYNLTRAAGGSGSDDGEKQRGGDEEPDRDGEGGRGYVRGLGVC